MVHKILGALVLVSTSIAGHAQHTQWPSLAKQGFISGRSATEPDVASGSAIFSTSAGNIVTGQPLKIAIPQYAYHIVSGKRVPVVVVQAEEVHGRALIGARDFSGQYLVGSRKEFELLGTLAPTAP